MNDLTTTPTADLIAEWLRQQQASSPFSSWAWNPEYQKEIAAELDSREMGAGMHEYQFPAPCVHNWIVSCQYWRRCAHCGTIRPTSSTKFSSTW